MTTSPKAKAAAPTKVKAAKAKKAISPKPGQDAPSPRLAAPPRIYNLFPLLVGSIDAWTRELPRIAAMNFDWVYLNPFQTSGFSGSLYATKDPFSLDPRFRPHNANTASRKDAALVGDFVKAANEQGMRVMCDLVIAHTSRDAPLAEDEPRLYRREADGELLSPTVTDPRTGEVTRWGDLASLAWNEPGAVGPLTDYWDKVIADLQALGVSGFRADAAYMVPLDVWRTLIERARSRDAGTVFMAEALGCPIKEAASISGLFDMTMNSFCWWDGRESWFLDQQRIFGPGATTVAFPESHDTARFAADASDAGTAMHRARMRYAMASQVSGGVMMPIGYEFGFTKRLDVVATTPDDWEDTGTDISDVIATLNAIKRDGGMLTDGELRRLSAPDAPLVALARQTSGTFASARKGMLVIANDSAEDLDLAPAGIVSSLGGVMSAMRDVTPQATPLNLHAASQPITAYDARVIEVFAPDWDAATVPKVDNGNRVVVERITPELDCGAHPIKRTVGDTLRVEADIFSDGHDKIAAEVCLRPEGEDGWTRVPMQFVDNDRWAGTVKVDLIGRHSYHIEAWRDRFDSWHNEVSKKRAAGQELSSELLEGKALLEEAAGRALHDDAVRLKDLHARAKKADTEAALDILLAEENRPLIRRNVERRNPTRSRDLTVVADRLAARFSAWYELFPRSAGTDGHRHGTFKDVEKLLPYVRDMGFDVLYFPPIHPIGEVNRKGKNNTLKAQPGDVGSVYGIGSKDGGHFDVEPKLGTLEDFDHLIAEAAKAGLEIAMDVAVQAAPDHPWIKQHPEWFDWRPDGTIKYAENPPKKYEDIVNVDFDKGGETLWKELRDMFLFWAKRGVRIFRVDNPHTKPLPFWRWVIATVNADYPDAIFLAEAFTRPKMMRALAKAGFQQSYTYFTWRNHKAEIIEYVEELAHSQMSEYYRPNFWPNTPDINPPVLQTGGRPAHVIRATLAALLSSNYGIYNGFELCEATPLPGREEYLDSEKYELRVWDYDRPSNIREHITALNRMRRDNPALWDWRNVQFLNAWNDQVLAFVKQTADRANTVMGLVSLDPILPQEATYEVPLWLFGLGDHESVEAIDLLRQNRFTLQGKTHLIRLDPHNPVAVWRLVPPTNAPKGALQA